MARTNKVRGSKPGEKHRQHDGGSPSARQEKQSAPDADRNQGGNPAEESGHLHDAERKFNMIVDSVPYMVTAVPYTFNGEVRYSVSFNGSPEHVFTWDSSLGQLRAIDDDSSTMPDNLEMAISKRLQSKG
jgi:hypothetical protein